MGDSFEYLSLLGEEDVARDLVAVRQSTVSFLDVVTLKSSYYIKLDDIKEVIANPVYTGLSQSKSWFLGLLKVQNEVYSVVDLEGFLFKKKNSSGRFAIVLSSPYGQYSIAVRGINGISRINNPKLIRDGSSIYEDLDVGDSKIKVLSIDAIIQSKDFNDVSLFNV